MIIDFDFKLKFVNDFYKTLSVDKCKEKIDVKMLIKVAYYSYQILNFIIKWIFYLYKLFHQLCLIINKKNLPKPSKNIL